MIPSFLALFNSYRNPSHAVASICVSAGQSLGGIRGKGVINSHNVLSMNKLMECIGFSGGAFALRCYNLVESSGVVYIYRIKTTLGGSK